MKIIDVPAEEDPDTIQAALEVRAFHFSKYKDAPAEEPEVPSHAIWPGLKLKSGHIGTMPRDTRKSVRIAPGHYPAPSEESEAMRGNH